MKRGGIKTERVYLKDDQGNNIIRFGIKFKLSNDKWVFLKKDNTLNDTELFETQGEANKELENILNKIQSVTFKNKIIKK